METIVDIGNCVVIAEEVGNCTFKQGLKKEKIISTRYLLTSYIQMSVSRHLKLVLQFFGNKLIKLLFLWNIFRFGLKKRNPIYLSGNAFSKS